MPERVSITDPAINNIQERDKNYKKQIDLLRSWLRSNTFAGFVLRVLVRRLKLSTSSHPYSDEDLHVLLLLTLAEMDQ